MEMPTFRSGNRGAVYPDYALARFDFDVRTADGRRFAERDVEIARWWCGLTSPGCG